MKYDFLDVIGNGPLLLFEPFDPLDEGAQLPALDGLARDILFRLVHDLYP